MPKSHPDPKKAATEALSVRFTTQLSLPAYDAITAIQHLYRTKTGRALPLWKVLDTAILEYAKQQGIKLTD